MFRICFILMLIAVGLADDNTKALNSTYANDELNWKVVGGAVATQGQFPYIVSLRDSSNRHFCGGSIITNRWVLTAAHCMVSTSPANVIVVVGTNTLNYGGIMYRVSRIIVHQNYNNNFKNDIALIELTNPITFTRKIQAIPLGVTNDNQMCTLAGWGSIYLGSESPNQLQYLHMNCLTTNQCFQRLRETDGTQLCTLTPDGQGACHGDSGGPLSLNGKLVGIVSYGKPCAKGVPDVYTRVSYFIDWIRNYVN